MLNFSMQLTDGSVPRMTDSMWGCSLLKLKQWPFDANADNDFLP